MGDPASIDWKEAFLKYNTLGLFYATRLLATYSGIREPAELAHDVVQHAWLDLWRAGKFSKNLFITSVLFDAQNAAASTKPIATYRVNSSPRRMPRHKIGCACVLCGARASMFPVQIFGCYIGETTSLEDVDRPCCGDE